MLNMLHSLKRFAELEGLDRPYGEKTVRPEFIVQIGDGGKLLTVSPNKRDKTVKFIEKKGEDKGKLKEKTVQIDKQCAVAYYTRTSGPRPGFVDDNLSYVVGLFKAEKDKARATEKNRDYVEL